MPKLNGFEVLQQFRAHEALSGVAVVSQSTYNRWRAQYGGMKAQEAKRLKELEDGNRRLKRLVADQALDIQILILKHINEIDAGNVQWTRQQSWVD